MQPCPRLKKYRGYWDKLYQAIGGPKWDKEDNTCSHCGSLHPNDVFQAIDDGLEITPTDKSYKIYIRGLDAKVRGAGKFYFQHFTDDERKKFVDLLNDGVIKFSTPGHFYVLPFFIKPATEQAQ